MIRFPLFNIQCYTTFTVRLAVPGQGPGPLALGLSARFSVLSVSIRGVTWEPHRTNAKLKAARIASPPPRGHVDSWRFVSICSRRRLALWGMGRSRVRTDRTFTPVEKQTKTLYFPLTSSHVPSFRACPKECV